MSKGAREEAMAAAANSRDKGDYPHVVVKGKRTKRMRLLQAISPASSSAELSGSTTTTTDEEDMANCLILLAQGAEARPGLGPEEEDAGGEKVSDRVSAEAAAVVAKEKAGFCAYECKTCNKCFPSFQALGGHRASHKKSKTSPAAAAAEEKMTTDEESTQIRISDSYSPINNITTGGGGANNGNGSKPRVHECSICGSEFSSGQALGGHMRRHRAPAAAEQPETKKARSGGLSLDLNLPAPADDELGAFPMSPSFAFPADRPLIFSGSALVGCHY